jgi:YfiH family protein
MTTNPPLTFATHTGPGFRWLDAAGVPLVAFTTRSGGVSRAPYDSLNLGLSSGDRAEDVHENRRRVLDALGIEDVATVSQVHGAEVQQVDAPGHTGPGDVLVTTRPDLALAIATADCLGVALWTEDRRALAAVHAGWRGIVAGALEAAVDRLLALRPGATLHAIIGPGIRACCFEVGPEVAERFPADCVIATSERPRVDLARAAGHRLAHAGVAAPRLHDLGECTSCNPATYYSHRRDQGTTGRHWALARLAPWHAARAGA